MRSLVQIPFDKNSKGKVRVNVGDSLIDIVAITQVERHKVDLYVTVFNAVQVQC